MKKVLGILLLMSGVVQARQLSTQQLQEIQDSHLEEVPKIIFSNSCEQDSYKFVYSQFLEEVSNMSDSRRERKLKSVYKWAFHVLQDTNPEYYQRLKKQGQLDAKTQTSATRAFLTRYAIYNKILIHQVHEQEKIAFKKNVSEYSKKLVSSLNKATKSLKEWLVS